MWMRDELVERHHEAQRHRRRRRLGIDHHVDVVVQLQLVRQFRQLARLAHLVLVDDRVQVLRQQVLRFRLGVQVRLRVDELTLRSLVTLPATTNPALY